MASIILVPIENPASKWSDVFIILQGIAVSPFLTSSWPSAISVLFSTAETFQKTFQKVS